MHRQSPRARQYGTRLKIPDYSSQQRTNNRPVDHGFSQKIRSPVYRPYKRLNYFILLCYFIFVHIIISLFIYKLKTLGLNEIYTQKDPILAPTRPLLRRPIYDSGLNYMQLR